MKSPVVCSVLLRLFAALVLLPLSFPSLSARTAALAGGPNPKHDEEDVIVLSPFCVTFGLAPGGFKSVNYARELVKYGMVPLPGEFTAEGLFSEHDLPLSNRRASKLVEVSSAAIPASIIARPEITHLVQLGFSSSMTPDNFRRDPLYITIVLDVSGSMEPYFDQVKAAVDALLGNLRDGDAVSIVTFSESATVVQNPTLITSWKKSLLRDRVSKIEIEGGTNIASGLRTGFALAETDPAGFSGRSRVFLVTDAMPNIDATAPEEFMALATDASLKGVGLTTVGLNIEFNSDFVRKVSSVSGGNAYWFADAAQMKERFDNDFDLLTTEVAFDFELHVAPAPGFRVAQVYGLPESSYAVTEDGGIFVDIPTLFLSREKGAIYLGLVATRAGNPTSGTVGRAEISYSLYGSTALQSESLDITLSDLQSAPKGLRRGLALISEYEAMQAAGRAFYEGNRISEAANLARAALEQVDQLRDSELAKERTFLGKVCEFLGAAAEEPEINQDLYRSRSKVAPLVGVWEELAENGSGAARWVFLPGGKVVVVRGGERATFSSISDWNRKGVGKKRANRLAFGVDSDGLVLSGEEGSIHLRRVVDERERDGASS